MRFQRMTGPQVTGLVLIVVVHLILIYDLFAYWIGGHAATVSAVLNNYIEGMPILAFTMGVFIGHVAWPLKK